MTLDQLFATLNLGKSLNECIVLYMLIFTRWLFFSFLIPFLGASLLPSLVRIALVALMSFVSFTVLNTGLELTKTIDILSLTMLFIKEALIGFVMGFLVSLIFYAYELAGEIMDMSRGASMARMLVPELKTQSSALGTLLFQFSLVIFISLGLHREMIASLFKSFETFPLLSLDMNLNYKGSMLAATQILGSLFALSCRFALPILFICFLIDLAFGLINRIAPQINAYFLSLPAKILGGLIILFLCLSFLMDDFLFFIEESNFMGIFLP